MIVRMDFRLPACRISTTFGARAAAKKTVTTKTT